MAWRKASLTATKSRGCVLPASAPSMCLGCISSNLDCTGKTLLTPQFQVEGEVSLKMNFRSCTKLGWPAQIPLASWQQSTPQLAEREREERETSTQAHYSRRIFDLLTELVVQGSWKILTSQTRYQAPTISGYMEAKISLQKGTHTHVPTEQAIFCLLCPKKGSCIFTFGNRKTSGRI